MEKPEEYRNRWALGLATTLSVVIFISFAFYKGYINLGGGDTVPQSQVASVIKTEAAPSPVESSKDTFAAIFKEITVQYQKVKDSLASVLVPFWSNIEVYEK